MASVLPGGAKKIQRKSNKISSSSSCAIVVRTKDSISSGE